jgi:hypothetical protein
MARDRALSTKRAAGFERARQLNAYTSAAMRFIFIYALLCFAERSSREGHSQIDEIARRRHAVISSKMDGDCLGDARCLFSRS